jgi:anti-sigma regulatory factor (Ser/Thr protein kinase)
MGPLKDFDWSVSPLAEESVWLAVEEQSAVAGVRRRATAMAERLGFTDDRVAQLALVVSEAASNLHKHAKGGVITLQVSRAGGVAAIELTCLDHGPGISDVQRSLRDGYSTSGTLGIGLGAIDRLADESGVYSIPGRGTVLTARFAAETDPSNAVAYSGLTRAMAGETACGDAFAVRAHQGVIYAMLCDGLGHGPLAALAAQEAIRAVQEVDSPVGPARLLEHVHRSLAKTRGSAVSIAAVDVEAGKVRFAGLGNVAGWIVDPDRRQGMISVPGIAGHQARSFREQTYDLPRGAAVVLHSDGLSGRWGPEQYPGLFTRHPLLIAAALLRDTGLRNDDRSILAVKAM